MNRPFAIALILTVVLVILPSGTLAFGAGDIPSFAYLENKAFRHGDIENVLAEIAKGATMAAGGSGLLGFAKQVIQQASSGGKFTKSDIKKVYFGNWLRDYSQCMDIGGLSKLSADTLVLVVSVLGFMTFGFATEEFQVTAERLGVYLPVEHIDNPKGYAEKEGDARQYHPKLRKPVNPRELEVDERNGMKNYIATEDGGWDSSTAHVRRVFRACIEYGRRAQGQEGPDLWESYRLLGTGLHTCEDFTAHSNWCEIALRKLGYEQVFCHVGEGTLIDTPSGRAPPLVTGTFGGADFLHSLMGEATDHISQASVTSLSQKMSEASHSDATQSISSLRRILGQAGGGDDEMAQAEDLHEKSKAYNFNPDDIAPPEVQQQLLALLNWRDGVYREVLSKIEMIPGLSDLIEELTDSLNAYVYTVIAPWVTPILEQATTILGEGSKEVINSADQYEVFDSDYASDPSHSLLSKDHFGLILNEPAGKVAQVVVIHTVQLIIEAWSTDSDPDQVIDQILEVFHHPYYANGRSRIQHEMMEALQKWLGGLGPDEASQTIEALTKESVRNGKNKRSGDEQNSGLEEPGYGPSKSSYGQGRGSGSNRPVASEEYGRSGSQQYDNQYRDNSERRSEYDEGREYGRRGEDRSEGHGRSDYSDGTRGYQSQEYGRSSGQQYDNQYSERSSATYDEGREEYGRRGEGRFEGQGNYSEGRRNQEYERSSNQQYDQYDRAAYGRGQDAYSEGNRYGEQDVNNRFSEQEDYGRGYSRQRDNDEYGSGRDGGYASRQVRGDSEAYSATEYDNSSYNPAYRSGADETFGAERLNLADDEGYESRRNRNEYDSGY